MRANRETSAFFGRAESPDKHGRWILAMEKPADHTPIWLVLAAWVGSEPGIRRGAGFVERQHVHSRLFSPRPS